MSNEEQSILKEDWVIVDLLKNVIMGLGNVAQSVIHLPIVPETLGFFPGTNHIKAGISLLF